MRRPIFLLLCLAVLAAGCDAASDWPSWVSAAVAKLGAQKPEGWESLEGEAAATRLYYQFVDRGGQVRFVERLDDVPETLRASVGFVKLAVPPPLSPGDAARSRRERFAGGAAASGRASAANTTGAPRIVLYSAEWCGACRKAKRYLASRGSVYEERDVDQPRYAEELHSKTGRRAVPVIDVDGRMLTGFSPDSYDTLLGRS